MNSGFTSPVDALRRLAEKHPQDVFLTQPTAEDIRTYTYAEAYDISRRLAQSLLSMPLQRGQHVGITSKNTAEWFILDWAIQMAGLVSVPLFPTGSAQSIVQNLAVVPVQFLFLGKLDNSEQFQCLTELGIPTASMLDCELSTDYRWQELVSAMALAEEKRFIPGEDDLLTIHFTSGSSGNAKGVELSYGAYHYACRNAITAMDLSPNERMMSYLPLAHIAERMMIEGNAVFSGAKVFFVHSLSTFVRDVKRAQPTAFMSVPRLWKNFQTAIHSKIPAPVLRVLLALPGIGWAMRKLIRKLLGLSHARLTGSGAAPMSEDLLQWYERIGIPISEAWGLTETCGLTSMNFPYQPERKGTIGVPVDGSEMKVDQQGEIWIRSKGLFRGYYAQAEETNASLDADGFFRSGDQGYWDEHRKAWVLTGRIKDNFKTAKGKFVAPQVIESKLLEHPSIEQACVIGAGHAQPSAIVQLAENESGQSIEEQLVQLMRDVNERLEKHEHLASIYISSTIWSPFNGLLTPTMKIKRQQIEKMFAHWVEKIAKPGVHRLPAAD